MKPNDDDLNELIDRNINPTKKKQDLPPKLRAEDAKRTLKMDYTSSREFRVKELINKLIRESEKLDNAVSETYNEAEVTEYNPCLVLGSVKDKRNCTIE